MPQQPHVSCIECGRATNAQGACVNPDCSYAQQSASAGGSRSTAKATAASITDQPRAWQTSGRVD